MGLSAFLTGRSYFGVVPGANPIQPISSFAKWTDDEPKSSIDVYPDDHDLKGLFYVNDPSNYYIADFLQPEQRWGYNDLERRYQDLCHLINFGCFPSKNVESVLANINFQPLPKGGH
jgi:hypothetical protein